MNEAFGGRLAERLRGLRMDSNLSLEALAARSGVSRAALSRLENAETSPTAEVLGKLCAAYGLPMSRLMRMVEDAFEPHLPRDAQPVWTDPATGYVRRSVSPPAEQLAGEAMEGVLPAGVTIRYDTPSRPGLEHHLVLLEGRLEIALGDTVHRLGPGDCLRYQLGGASRFTTAELPARYLLFMV